MNGSKNYSLSMSFENVAVPPFQDILVVTQKSPHGKIGLTGSMNLLQPDQFEIIEIEDDLVEILIINKRILKRISLEKVMKILKDRVFPYIVKGEIVKVDFKVRVSYDNIELSEDEGHAG